MILIIAAMESEVKELRRNFKEKNLYNNRKYYQGSINDKEVIVLITGVGKVNAGLHLAAILMKENISKIINVGFGGAKGDFQIGEAVLIKKATYGDVDVTAFSEYELGQLPKLPHYFNSDPVMFRNFKEIITKEGLLYTQDKFVLKSEENDCLFDMEGAGFYQAAHLFKKPIVAIKVVSDLIGQKGQLENYQNFEKNSSYLIKEIIEKVI